MSNLGHMRGIDGSLTDHLRYAHRHIYCSVSTQKKIQDQLALLLERQNPDICCFAEIDRGSGKSGNFDQLRALTNKHYPFSNAENKYGKESLLRKVPFTRGKSNAILAKKEYVLEKLYFSQGAKRLVYKIHLEENLTLFFAHFSLRKKTRAVQLEEAGRMVEVTTGECIFLGDFNITTGFEEIETLLQKHDLTLLNQKDIPTFRFSGTHKILDLCLCTRVIANKARLSVIAQSFSDHDALVLEVHHV